MRTAEGPFPMETPYTWTATAAGSTLMTLRNHGEPSGFMTALQPFMIAAMRRANRKDLAKLKVILEAEHDMEPTGRATGVGVPVVPPS